MRNLETLNVGEITEPQLNTSAGSDGTEDDDPQKPVYGSDTPCFYNCLAYVAEMFGWHCSPTEFANDYEYGSMYKERFGEAAAKSPSGWKGTGRDKDRLNGPDSYVVRNENRYANPQAHDYVDAYFNTFNNGWQTTNEVPRLLDFTIGGYVIAVKDQIKRDSNGCVEKGSNEHAVILESYDKKKETYSYYDPTSGKEGTCSKTDVHYGDFIRGIDDPTKK